MTLKLNADPYMQPGNVYTGADGGLFARLPHGGEVPLTEQQIHDITEIGQGAVDTYPQAVASLFAKNVATQPVQVEG